MSNAWQPRCGHCGLFCVPADSYTPWGDANPGGDPEPYDPVDLCSPCAREVFEKLLAGILRRGIPFHESRPYWYSPLAWYRALGVARGMARHGLWDRPVLHQRVRQEFRGGLQVWECGNCRRPERHPGHNRKEATRLGLSICWKFERSVGRWVVPGKIRLRCSCGWATPIVLAGGRAGFELDDALRAHRDAHKERKAS